MLALSMFSGSFSSWPEKIQPERGFLDTEFYGFSALFQREALAPIFRAGLQAPPKTVFCALVRCNDLALFLVEAIETAGNRSTIPAIVKLMLFDFFFFCGIFNFYCIILLIFGDL